MTQRLAPDALYTLCPRIHTHLLALDDVIADSGVEPRLQHLIRLRVSQINHCGYCQHLHSEEARQAGERQARLDVLPAWREVPCFTRREKAALAWAEALTLIARERVATPVYEAALAEFGMVNLLELSNVVLAINAWNRLAGALQFAPPIPATDAANAEAIP